MSLVKVKIIKHNISDEWNQLAVHPLQRWEWGEARKEMGIEVVRIGEYKNNILNSVYQLTFHSFPYTPFKIGYLPKSLFPSEEILSLLREEGKKRKAIFIKIEPFFKLDTTHTYEQKKVYTNDNFFDKKSNDIFNFYNIIKSNHPLFTEWNQIIDITLSEEELIRKMKPKTRYNIRLAERKGLNVKEMTNDEGFEIFSSLYFTTCKRHNYRGHTKFYHQTIFKHFRNKVSHILIAFYRDKPLSAYHLFHHLDTLYYSYGGSSLEYKNLMAPNLLMWEAIKLGKKLGCKVFDMWGSLAPDYNDKDPWAGFTRFKEGYGSIFVKSPGSYDLILSSLFYNVYSFLYKIRKYLL